MVSIWNVFGMKQTQHPITPWQLLSSSDIEGGYPMSYPIHKGIFFQFPQSLAMTFQFLFWSITTLTMITIIMQYNTSTSIRPIWDLSEFKIYIYIY